MKKLLVFIFICLVASTGNAKAEPFGCELIESFAIAVMEARQTGVKLSDMYKVTGDIENANLRALMQKVVIGAYERPKITTEPFKSEEVTEYANIVFAQCLELLKEIELKK